MRTHVSAALMLALVLTPPLSAARVHAQLDEETASRQAEESLQKLLAGGEARSVRMLGELGHSDPERRVAAAKYLGSRREAGAVPALIPLLADGSTEVRNQAAWALWRIGKPTAIAARTELEALLTSEADGNVRVNAAGALWRIGNPTAELRPSVEPVLDHDNGYTRARAADLLLRMGAPADELVSTYERTFDSGNEKLRHYVVKLLSDHDDTPLDFAPLMVRALKDPQETVRILATVELNRMGVATPEVVAALHEAASDPSETVRATALIALSRVDPEGSGPSAAPAGDSFLTGLRDPEPNVRAQAARSVAQAGCPSPQAAAALVAALDDEAQEVRAAAAESLWVCGESASIVIPALWARWKDKAEHSTVRHAAGRSLVALGEAVDWAGDG